MGELGKATGEALVELAKTLPFIAPVAFLLCAVASSAATASGARVVPVFPLRGSTPKSQHSRSSFAIAESLWPTWSHARTHARTHARARAQTHARTNTRTRAHTNACVHPTTKRVPPERPSPGALHECEEW
jgi:hypothetical protein